jgi:C1A family cysteine protease
MRLKLYTTTLLDQSIVLPRRSFTMIRKYGRKIPLPLPAHRMLSRRNPELPPGVDTRAYCGPIKDQGNEGSCTAHAGTSANEWIHRAYLKSLPVFSPQYTYAKELLRQGSFPNDVGSDGDTLCNTLIANGCCEESLYPYTAGQIIAPTTAQDLNAAGARLGAYHGLVGSETALSVLADSTPWPVAIGFTVYESFESPSLASSGVMPVPRQGEQILGGHEVLMVGYDIGDTPWIRPASCPPAALIQNSWGTGWGCSGFFWMPLSVLDAPDTDLKIAHSGNPWK